MDKVNISNIIKTTLRQNRSTLDLSNLGLDVLPGDIKKLRNIKDIYLTGNNLTKLPKEILNLENLQIIDLSNNQFAEFPEELCNLPRLSHIYFEKNRIGSLPQRISLLTNLMVLDLNGNQLPIPPEIISKIREPKKIINYYIQHYLTVAEKKPLNEAKLLIVGQGSVGKTSLIERLTKNHFNPYESKTEGINVTKWIFEVNTKRIQLNIWDFGGQEIMHATHQFFLSRRSLYALVLDSRLDEKENRLEYWLKIIHSFGGNSPVIVICNKSDQQKIDLDWTGLNKKYPTIKSFSKSVSCKNGEGIVELHQIIQQEAFQLDHLNDELLKSWFDVKNQLETMEENYITYNKYSAICKKRGVADDVSQQTLIEFLHDLGVILHFSDHPILEDTNVLNPEWVTKGVYGILNSNKLFQNKGILNIDDLDSLLNLSVYLKKKHMFLIDMMRKFELCFDFEGYAGKRLLIPDLLPKEEPYTGEWSNHISFQYHYDVLPHSVISRFIVRMHSYIYRNTYWRNGVVLISEDDANIALIKADLEDNKIFIYVKGTKETQTKFLDIIRSDFRKIHSTIPELQVKEKVPLPDHQNILVDYNHLITLKELNEKLFIPEGWDKKINVMQLLREVDPEMRPSTDVTIKKSNPWVSGSFYLLAFIVIINSIAIVSDKVPWYTLPIVLIAAIIGLSIIGAFTLRQDQNLSEENFISLMLKTLKQLPLIKKE